MMHPFSAKASLPPSALSPALGVSGDGDKLLASLDAVKRMCLSPHVDMPPNATSVPRSWSNPLTPDTRPSSSPMSTMPLSAPNIRATPLNGVLSSTRLASLPAFELPPSTANPKPHVPTLLPLPSTYEPSLSSPLPSSAQAAKPPPPSLFGFRSAGPYSNLSLVGLGVSPRAFAPSLVRPQQLAEHRASSSSISSSCSPAPHSVALHVASGGGTLQFKATATPSPPPSSPLWCPDSPEAPSRKPSPSRSTAPPSLSPSSLYNMPASSAPQLSANISSSSSSSSFSSSAQAQAALEPTNVYTGVSRSGVNGRWRAQLSTRGRTLHLGTFATAQEAAQAWDVAAIEERGKEAVTNFDIHGYLDADGLLRKDIQAKACRSRDSAASAAGGGAGGAGGAGAGGKEFRGVYHSGTYGRWKARIVIDGQKVHLGTFATAEEAARAWDKKAIEKRGADTLLNFDIADYVGSELQAAAPKEHGARSTGATQQEHGAVCMAGSTGACMGKQGGGNGDKTMGQERDKAGSPSLKRKAASPLTSPPAKIPHTTPPSLTNSGRVELGGDFGGDEGEVADVLMALRWTLGHDTGPKNEEA